ncbi:hypothetical protein JB92DRAFT_2976298 [Gautieria morchelliformis]|nr:hypothetical protein JB92DRAFT_2976298 [Gautieria morchelliformis]
MRVAGIGNFPPPLIISGKRGEGILPLEIQIHARHGNAAWQEGQDLKTHPDDILPQILQA